MQEESGMRDPNELRKLAAWYREFERAGNPVIWDARLRTAEDLDAEADAAERSIASVLLTDHLAGSIRSSTAHLGSSIAAPVSRKCPP